MTATLVEGGSAEALAVQLQRAELEYLGQMARDFPRSDKRARAKIIMHATQDADAAQDCIYALPRSGRAVLGPSVRFAEIVKQAYGNCMTAARVVEVNRGGKYVEASAVFTDLQTGTRSQQRARRGIIGARGRIMPPDGIFAVCAVASAIAVRNVILTSVPRPLWREGYEAALDMVRGDTTAEPARRFLDALEALEAAGIDRRDAIAAIGRTDSDVSKITDDEIVVLRAMVGAIRRGESTVEEMTAPPASAFETLANPLDDTVTE